MSSRVITICRMVLLTVVVLLSGCDKKPPKPDLDLNPLPTTGTLIVTSLPTGSAFSITALQRSGITPDTLLNIEPGQYEIVLTMDGYHSFTGTAVVEAGKRTDFFHAMDRGYGSVTFVTSPPGATVLFNQTMLDGTTPFLETGLPAGRHSVRFLKSGYADWTDSVTVLMDDTTIVEAALDTLLGLVYVTTSPPGADVYFGIHPTPKASPALDSLPPGSHQIRAELSGYRTASQQVVVAAFETTTIDFEMVLITGTVDVSSTPTGAQIYVNDLPTGLNTPSQLLLVPAKYELSIRKAGYYDWDSTITVNADQSMAVGASLDVKPTSITVTSTPSSAAIVINGVGSGFTTPHTFDEVSPGKYSIRLTLPGRFPADSTFTTVLGTDNQLFLTLPEAPDVPFAYTQGTRIYLANLDGVITDTLTIDYLDYIDSYIDYYGSIRWSPNGERLAYTGRTRQVSIIKGDGTWINGFSGNRSMDFCWSPDSDRLVWGVYCGGMYENILSNNWYGRISTGCYDNSPAFSPNAKKVMCMYHNWGTDCRIDVMNPNGSGRVNIYGWFGAGFDEFNQLNWTSDSSAIFKIAGKGVYEVTIPDSGNVKLTKRIADAVSQLQLSPDRRWCAYNTSSGIYLMEVGVWLPYRITSVSAYSFSVMAGGEFIACRTADGVYVVKSTGEQYHVIVDKSAGRGAVDIRPR